MPEIYFKVIYTVLIVNILFLPCQGFSSILCPKLHVCTSTTVCCYTWDCTSWKEIKFAMVSSVSHIGISCLVRVNGYDNWLGFIQTDLFNNTIQYAHLLLVTNCARHLDCVAYTISTVTNQKHISKLETTCGWDGVSTNPHQLRQASEENHTNCFSGLTNHDQLDLICSQTPSYTIIPSLQLGEWKDPFTLPQFKGVQASSPACSYVGNCHHQQVAPYSHGH